MPDSTTPNSFSDGDQKQPRGDRNILLTVSYDGTAYSGWQIQPGHDSVQQRLEQAVLQLTGENRRILCAGRTDAGVHALGQSAGFFTNSRIPEDRFGNALQTALPDDITIIKSREVSHEFHATYSAVRKTYRYVMLDRGRLPPFLRPYCTEAGFQLDAERMQRAARHLQGTHDFRCFESHWPNKQTSVRTIERTAVFRTQLPRLWQSQHHWVDPHKRPSATAAADGPVIVLEFTADGFLYNMVRAIAGTLIDIGRGKCPEDFLSTVIAAQDRSQAGMTAPPQGLYLVSVEYPDHLLQPSHPPRHHPAAPRG